MTQEFHTNIRHSLATGARVAVHAPSTLPFMKRGVTISPGVESTIEVTDVHRVRLSQPWGTCTAQQYLDTPGPDHRQGARYTSESCFEICKQEQVSCLIYRYTIRAYRLTMCLRTRCSVTCRRHMRGIRYCVDIMSKVSINTWHPAPPNLLGSAQYHCSQSYEVVTFFSKTPATTQLLGY